MCQFVDEMEKLKSSSKDSVAKEEFTEFNEYMHTESKMDERLAQIVNEAKNYSKSLILVCGNSGDGKSHLIARLEKQKIIDNRFSVHIDATSADKKGMRANEKLREKLLKLSDEKIHEKEEYRLIVAINLGILNDFLKNYGEEFSVLKNYVEEQGIFDVVPSWKFEKVNREKKTYGQFYISHVDFTSFHRYEITPDGLNLDFIKKLLEKIVANDDKNKIRCVFDSVCGQCPKRSNCPVQWNYRKLVSDESFRNYVIRVLATAVIKHSIALSVRDINNFFYEIIIGDTFDETMIISNSVQRLIHFINNLTITLLFEGKDGLLPYVAEQDILNEKTRSFDRELTALNLKPSFEKWLKDEAVNISPEFGQIEADVIYCEGSQAQEYRKKEQQIKKSVFKYYIRLADTLKMRQDKNYEKFLSFLYAYNTGNEQQCKELIGLVKDSIYVWNGRLGDKSGASVKNAVIIGKGTDRYYLFKNIDIQFQINKQIEKMTYNDALANFASTLRFHFALKEKPQKSIILDIDYELYELLAEIGNGYVPANTDRKQNVNFDSFVRILLAESESDIYVYSRYEDGKIYKIAKDEFGGYVFENEG